MTSALLFVALLVVVDLSYRRWMRRSVARRRVARRAEREIVLDVREVPEAAVVRMRARPQGPRDARRNG